MIFGKTFNTIICMLLKGDKSKSNEILSFIDSIPQELLNKLSVSIESMESNDDNTSDYDYCENDKGELFEYQIVNDFDYILTLSRSINVENQWIQQFDLTLVGGRFKHKNNNCAHIADITYSVTYLPDPNKHTTYNSCENISYNLYRTKFGTYLQWTDRDYKGKKTEYSKMINFKGITKSVEDLEKSEQSKITDIRLINKPVKIATGE